MSGATTSTESDVDRSLFRSVRCSILFAAAFVVCTEAGQFLSFPGIPFATFWPASGLCVAVLAMAPRSAWPRLIVAAALANLLSNVIFHDQPPLLSLAFSVANVIEAVIGALLIGAIWRRLQHESAFQSLLVLAGAGPLAAACGATIGAAAVAAARGGPLDWRLWGLWWGADVIGILFVGPVVFSWWNPATIDSARRWTPWRSVEAIAMLGGLTTLTYLIGLVDQYTVRSLPFRAFPFLVWSAARFGIRGTSLSLLVFFAILVGHTVQGQGPFAIGSDSAETRIMALQLAAGIFALTFLSLAAVIQDRDQALLVAEQSKAAAEAATAAKGRFLANMSHELRTPLNGMVAMTGLVLDSRLDPQQRERLMLVNLSAESLRALVNDILDVSKAEAGRLELRPSLFSLQACLDELLTLLRAQTEKQRIAVACRIHPDVPDVLLADKNRLRQILSNLLGNAVKFTSEGSIRVDVEVESRSAEGCVLHFCVSDTGIGIASDVQQRLFQPFEQGVSSTQYGGTGLGLSIDRQLSELMGGRVWLESEPGRGSRFHFTARVVAPENVPPLPRSSDTVPALPPSPPSRTLASGRKALLVEDDVVNAEYSRVLLEQVGFQVSIAPNGAQAVRLWRGDRFDLVLSDVRMPVLNGVEMTKQIRSLEQGDGRRTPIITFTAAENPEDRDACLQAGADGFLMKPLKQTELVSVVTDLLRLR